MQPIKGTTYKVFCKQWLTRNVNHFAALYSVRLGLAGLALYSFGL